MVSLTAFLVLAAAQQPAATTTRFGLHTTTFDAPQGKITVNLPDDMAAGDTISGTVIDLPAGNSADARQANMDTLQGFVVDVDAGRQQAKSGKFQWTIPAVVSGLVTLVLHDSHGRTIAKATVPCPKSPPQVINPGMLGSDGTYLPSMGQAGRPMRIFAPGKFNGAFGGTSVSVGGTSAEMLACSPRELVSLAPNGVTGATTLDVSSGDWRQSAPIHIIRVALNAPRTRIMRGDQVPVTVQVDGLRGLEHDVAITLHNASPSVVSMEGGNDVVRTVPASEIADSDRASFTQVLTSLRGGEFVINASVLADGAPHVKGVTWPPHKKDVTFPPAHYTGQTWPTHVEEGSWPQHFKGVSWPSHLKKVTFPPNHYKGQSWPTHVKDGTWPTREKGVSWSPHQAKVSFPPAHGKGTTWPAHVKNATWP